ncbi:class I SAM-dependent methyltransferase [Ensifer sp. T173]|uniref:Class I SAM-dependent methyltransferase n=1 Tax=Ensifer canadensis TaxID=555315 RepID=A0AAW4FU44_9HYPH|nr:class I SAM-dependent methyltransferase [Ensifer canadensis]MBM3094837.1 class I SAM-dependent methyltransferase [Ensifer canadensis]UBI79094.1 class I SAM-dependent methyltransferase [Ensifer canadensis]
MFGLKKLIRRDRNIGKYTTEQVFDQYSREFPRHQNAVDALAGWNSAFPPEVGLKAGTHPLFADGRITWAISQAGSLANKNVIEVGPLEGMHTYMLNQHKPRSIDAIEANRGCFLRCLVTKEVLGIDRANFYLGDALRWLQETEVHYDLAIASGVLYHMPDPGQFLCDITSRCDQLFIWTHYFDDHAMPTSDSRRQAFSGNVETRTFSGIPVRYFERGYFNANENENFCGGMKDRHYWMHRDDIISLLNALGFGDISIGQEDLAHGGGPCFSLFAKRSEPAR